MIGISIYAGYNWFRDNFGIGNTNVQKNAILPSVAYQYSEVPSLDVTIVQIGEGKQILECGQNTCTPKRIPTSLQGDALSDGESWYRYVQEDEDILLQRTWMNGERESETIVKQMPFIQPRGMYISPDGKKLAYWLDNISDNQQLTELWMYDSEQEGTHLIAEKLVKPDIVTKVRWNRSSTALWFIANNAEEKKQEKLEYVTVNIHPENVQARFLELDWEQLKDIADTGAMDISRGGNIVAYAEHFGNNVSKLTVLQDGEKPWHKIVRGYVPFIQWKEDDSLIYAVQDTNGVAFWQAEPLKRDAVSENNKQIAHILGTYQSAQTDSRGEYIAIVVKDKTRKSIIHTLQMATGLTKPQAQVPTFGKKIFVVHANQQDKEKKKEVAGTTTELSDEEITAFIENNLPDVANYPEAKPQRIIMTETANTAYVDYKTRINEMERILMSIQDAIHPEWTIKGRYRPTAGEWEKFQGGGLKDPEAKRLYEWEESINKWILKEG